MSFFKETSDGLILTIFVLPKSSKNMTSGVHGDALKIKLTAPPVEGAANKMCLKFLAKFFKVSKSALEIVSGHTSRTKQVLVRLENEKEKKRLQQLLESI